MSSQVVVPKAGGGKEHLPSSPPKARQRAATPYLLLVPTALFLTIFFAWPMVQALLLAFQDGAGAFTLGNFQRMTGDYAFWPAVRTTLLLLVVTVPAQVVLALVMALLIQAGLRGSGFFLYVWAIPLAISDLAAGIVWLSIFTDNGYLNSVLVPLGLVQGPFAFLSYEHPLSAFLAVVIAEAWRATSIVMVILLAGLQGIPKEYDEAAQVFGANFRQRIWKVTLPLLRPSLQVALILRTILAFQVFAVLVALTGRNLPVLAGEAYYWYSSYRDVNVAAAYAMIILGVSLVTTIIYLRALRVSEEQTGAVR